MRMNRFLSVLFLLALTTSTLHAGLKPLKSLELDEGQWEMVGVKLFNYKMLPIQEELGTFICKDIETIKTIANTFEGQYYYEDWCDHHYALKFYQNGQLKKTLKVNLWCDYMTDGVISFHFDPTMLTRHKAKFKPMNWATIKFTDIAMLRRAITKMRQDPSVYLYHDNQEYFHDGYFVVATRPLDLMTNRDSLEREIRRHISRRAGSEEFLIKPFIEFLDDNMKVSFRYEVYCNEPIFDAYNQAGARYPVTAHWRDHFAFWKAEEDPYIKITVMGMTKDKYMEMMR